MQSNIIKQWFPEDVITNKSKTRLTLHVQRAFTTEAGTKVKDCASPTFNKNCKQQS